MRERKHRAWHKESKKMLYDTSANIFKWQAEGQLIEIMDFVGLKDRHGKEIYEGDIARVITYYDSPSHVVRQTKMTIGTIEFKDGSFMVGDDKVFDFVNIEIIGNLFEHPELLKQ